ncbi:MAG TPA: ABC transporter substrate-binding protein [Intrasporangium sp.]|uniref:ABC transporter substrate-binding protein n=1 Tax=Intrasporangium sp. TaxID=1925024 RepID=UPI002D777AA5|nr:ABC transporter substrate-binding protein [Intrasporangium sp.]HET7398430.1 ABC transporter substrate-binding protein [Intrasporangium sp.]
MNGITRRGFLGLAGAAGVTAGLAACAGTGTSPTGNPSGGAAGGGALEFWSNHPGSSKEVEQKLIAAFEAANSGIKVKLVDAGKNYEEVAQKFNAALAGGQLPDVVVVSDVTWFNFALNKQLTPLDELVSTAGVKVDDYVDALYKDYLFNGKHYALPYSRSTPLFYYNKELWKAAGLEDRGPKDWQEFKAWSTKLKAAVGSDKVALELADGSNYLDWYFQNMVWGFGGAYSKEWTPTFSDPKTIEAGQFLQDLAKAGVVRFNKAPATDFSAGLAACILESTGSLGGIAKDAKFEFGTAFLPGTDNCPTGGAGIGIPAGLSDDRKKNALKFAEFLTNPQNTATFTQATGYMPVRKSAAELPEEQAFLDKHPNSRTAILQLPHTRSQDNARVLVPGGGARIGKALDQVAQGQDVATVFKALDAETQRVIDAQIKPKL